MQTLKNRLRPCCIAALCLAAAPACHGAASLWSTSLNFTEFAGSPGGFEPGISVLQTAATPGAVAREYDVLRQTVKNLNSGTMAYVSGQDGLTDLTITTRVVDGSQGRWASVQAGKRPTGYNGGSTIYSGTSRSGDWGLVALEFRFAPGMEITADRFSLYLTSANGTSEAYEWTMVTLGGMMDAPFSMARIGSYGATDYNNMSSSSYYSALGAVTGQPGSGQRLGTGRSMSQFLTGSPASSVSGGLVQPGWYAVDDFNARVFDGPEADWDNPYADDGVVDDNPTITGTMMGLNPSTRISAFTIWIGVNDVAFDSDGDGFTSTDGNPFASIAQLSFGSSPDPIGVPEPTTAVLGLLFPLWMNRRIRK